MTEMSDESINDGNTEYVRPELPPPTEEEFKTYQAMLDDAFRQRASASIAELPFDSLNDVCGQAMMSLIIECLSSPIVYIRHNAIHCQMLMHAVKDRMDAKPETLEGLQDLVDEFSTELKTGDFPSWNDTVAKPYEAGDETLDDLI